jgi:hypothetical protein
MNVLLEKIGIELPIVQAPMAGVSTPALAAAVSNGGGLGRSHHSRDLPESRSDRPLIIVVSDHFPALDCRPQQLFTLIRVLPCNPWFSPFAGLPCTRTSFNGAKDRGTLSNHGVHGKAQKQKT